MAKYIISAFIAVYLVAFINAGAVPPEFKEMAPDVRKVCLAENDIHEDLILKATDGDFSDDPKFKCYLKCVLHQFGAISATGIKFDVIEKLAPPSVKAPLGRALTACKDTKPIKAGDLCDLVYEVSKCFQKIMLQDYFII